MPNALNQDVHAIREWLRSAWRSLADPSLTRVEMREIRNSMKGAEVAMRAGLRRLEDRERASRKAVRVLHAGRRLDFRIIRLDV